MLKAQQSAVIHNANVNMVSLRNAEIQYFSSFFSSFGTQSALIAGFVVNSVSQVPGNSSGLQDCRFLRFLIQLAHFQE
jgi:hypothetical protein